MITNLKALRLFRQIVVTGSLSEAAGRINLSTSAASRLLGLLEAEVGLTLFSRERRRLVLTEEGDAFYRRLASALDGLEEIPALAADIRNRAHDWLSVVTAAPLACSLVAPTLAVLDRTRGSFRCSLSVEPRFDIESKVAARGYNLGLVSLPVENAILDLDVEPFLKARIEALLPRGHPLAARDAIAVTDLAAERIVGLRPRQLWRDRIDALMGGAGLQPRIAVETSSTIVTIQLVREGLGLSLIDRATFSPRPDDSVVLCPLVEERWVTYACLHAHGPRAPLATPFLDAMSEVVEARRAADPAAEAALELI